MKPTFLARYLRDGALALQCRQTGTRYIVAAISRPHHDDCAAYREGQMIRTGPRAACVDAVESDSRWSIRSQQPFLPRGF